MRMGGAEERMLSTSFDPFAVNKSSIAFDRRRRLFLWYCLLILLNSRIVLDLSLFLYLQRAAIFKHFFAFSRNNAAAEERLLRENARLFLRK